MARKTFDPGEVVEVKLHRGESWRDAVYSKAAGTPGVHQVWYVGHKYEIDSRNIRKRARAQEGH